MLGRFLEFSVATPDIGASLEFYARLGFEQARVGDAWAHPYAVLTDGRINVGLHVADVGTPQVTFVRPGLLHQLDALERLGIDFDTRRLGNDVFNEIGWCDPSGNLLRLVEARTFSPQKVPPGTESLCGHFREIGLPATDPERAKAWWERLGFVGLDEPDAQLPHVCCTSDTVNIGLYAAADLAAPTLVFEVDDVPASIAALAATGIRPARHAPGGLAPRHAALLTAPEGTPILVYSNATD